LSQRHSRPYCTAANWNPLLPQKFKHMSIVIESLAIEAPVRARPGTSRIQDELKVEVVLSAEAACHPLGRGTVACVRSGESPTELNLVETYSWSEKGPPHKEVESPEQGMLQVPVFCNVAALLRKFEQKHWVEYYSRQYNIHDHKERIYLKTSEREPSAITFRQAACYSHSSVVEAR